MAATHVCYGIHLFIVCVIKQLLVSASLKGPHDICELEIFNATCSDGEIILMNSSMYGRMSLGKCIKEHIGSKNCDSDVLHVTDSMCSGLQSCVITPFDRTLMTLRRCPEHSAFLRIHYTCVKASNKNLRYCRNEVRLDQTYGYLSSALLHDNSEGTRICPWVLNTEGKRYNITMYKFASYDNSPLSSSTSVCFEVGTVQEGSLSQGMLSCGSDPRQKVVYISKGGPVRIYFKDQSFLKDLGNFVFHFEVLDCEPLSIPEEALFKREGDVGTVTCNNGAGTWQLKCQDGQWQGQYGTCTAEESTTVLSWIKVNAAYSAGLLGLVTLCCALVIFIGGFCLYATYFYATRHFRQGRENHDYNIDIYKLQTMERVKSPPVVPTYERTTSLRASQATLKRNSDYQRMNPIDPETASHHSYVLYDHVPKPLPPIPIEEKKHVYETPHQPVL